MAYQEVSLFELRRLLADRWDGVPWWTVDDADRALNEALRVWNLATGTFHESSTAVLVPNDPFVVLRAPLVMGTRLRYGTTPLAPTSLFDLDQARPGWQGETGTPWVWAAVSLRLVAVYPPTALLNQLLVAEGLATTPVLVHPTDDKVNLGEEELGAILSYALHAAAYKVGGELIDQTEPHRQAFWSAAFRQNAQLRRSMPLRLSQGRHDVQIDPVDHEKPRGPQ